MYLTIILMFLLLKHLNNMEKDKHCNRKMSKSHEYTNCRRENTNITHVIFNFTNNQSQWPVLGPIFFPFELFLNYIKLLSNIFHKSILINLPGILHVEPEMVGCPHYACLRVSAGHKLSVFQECNGACVP